MRSNRLKGVRERLMADPAFAAGVVREKAIMLELDLAAVRAQTKLRQADIALRMNQTQENVSRIERQRDIKVSTLQAFVIAQGGSLEVNAVYDGKKVPLLRPAKASAKVRA